MPFSVLTLSTVTLGDGIQYAPDYFSRKQQEALINDIREVLQQAPLFTPTMPRTNKPFSVRMSNCGDLGWVSDQNGYRYQKTHPVTGASWPTIPAPLLALWDALSGYSKPPQACLINLYDASARMGLHQDKDEENFSAPVVSVSLGATARFRMGGLNRRDPTRSIKLHSGDVFVFGGASRLMFHGIDRVYEGTSMLLPNDQRLNLTLRRVAF
jgi:DNA oxidative demethylase